MGKQIEQTVCRRRNPNGQYIHEEMLNIFRHKGNASQNYTKIPSHPSLIGNYQENKQHQMLV
jgi:hypothetical protein